MFTLKNINLKTSIQYRQIDLLKEILSRNCSLCLLNNPNPKCKIFQGDLNLFPLPHWFGSPGLSCILTPPPSTWIQSLSCSLFDVEESKGVVTRHADQGPTGLGEYWWQLQSSSSLLVRDAFVQTPESRGERYCRKRLAALLTNSRIQDENFFISNCLWCSLHISL